MDEAVWRVLKIKSSFKKLVVKYNIPLKYSREVKYDLLSPFTLFSFKFIIHVVKNNILDKSAVSKNLNLENGNKSLIILV